MQTQLTTPNAFRVAAEGRHEPTRTGYIITTDAGTVATWLIKRFTSDGQRREGPRNEMLRASPREFANSQFAVPAVRVTLDLVSMAEQPVEPAVRFYEPDEAAKRARPLPPRQELVLDDVTDEEWTAFYEALAET
jgi:hypothetical protein